MKLVLSFQDSLLDCLISIEHKLISKKWYSPIFAHNLEFAIFVAHSVFNLYCEHVSSRMRKLVSFYNCKIYKVSMPKRFTLKL